MAIITLKEYAIRHGMNPTDARHKAQRGGFDTAHKFGRDWVIDEDEPNVDRRVKSGAYRGQYEKYGRKYHERKKAQKEGNVENEQDSP